MLSEKYLATILNQAPDAIFALDLNCMVIATNEAANRLFSLSADDAVGRPALQLFAPEVHEEISALLERGRAGETIIGHETVILPAGAASAHAAKGLFELDQSLIFNPSAFAFRDVARGHASPTICRLELQHAQKLSAILVDPNQLENAILNLILNARNASEAGQCEDCDRRAFRGRPDTRAKRRDDSRGLRFDLGRRPRRKQSGGHIDIESELGRGTTNSLVFPFATSASIMT